LDTLLRLVPTLLLTLVLILSRTVLYNYLISKGLVPNKETGFVETFVIFAFLAGVGAGWVGSKAPPKKKDKA